MHNESASWRTYLEIGKAWFELLVEFCLDYWRQLLVVLALLLIYLWHTATSVYLSYHRKVILIGARSKEYEVLINEQPVTLKPFRRVELLMAEGDFHIRPSKSATGIEPLSIRLETPFWSRPYQSAVLVINPDKLAILRESEIFYGNVSKTFPDELLHCNEAGYVFSRIDDLFEPPPKQITVWSSSRGRTYGSTRRQLELLDKLSDRDRTELVSKGVRRRIALEYLERWREDQPDNPFAARVIDSLKDTLALQSPDKPIPGKSLAEEWKSRLLERPLSVAWHRTYQDSFLQKGEESSLVGEYRKLAESMPNDNAARYLLSRVCPLDEEIRLLEESVKAGQPAPHAHFALSCRYLAEGRFREAAREMRTVNPDQLDHSDYYRYAKMTYVAANDLKEYLWVSAKESKHTDKTLLSTNKTIEEYRFKSIFDKKYALETSRKGLAIPVLGGLKKGELTEVTESLMRRFQHATALSTQDIGMYLGLESGSNGSASPIHLAILTGNTSEALTLLHGPPSSKDPFFDRALVLLAKPKGEDSPAWKELRESFLEEMGKRRHERIIQQMIEDEIPFDMKLIRKAACDPESKRILIYLAAKWMPDHAEELKTFAKQLDFACDEISLCLKRINP